MADKQFNITNNSPNYTKNNNINNINYVKRNGAGWSWFKTIFIACMLTIFSVVCFAGGNDAIPQGYTNSIRQETIKTLVGFEEIPPEKDIIYDNLTLDNITDYTFSFKHSFEFPIEYYNNFNPLNDNDILGLGNVIDKDNINMFDINSDVIYNNSAYPDIYYYGMYRFPYVSSYVPINYSIYNMAGHIGFNTWYKNGRYGFKGESFDYLLETKSRVYNFGLTTATKFTYYNIKFTDNYVIYYKIAYGNDLTKFHKLLDFLYYSTDFVNLPTTTKPIYVEYPVKYATYDWNIKLNQLSKLKNVFTPLFSSNIPDEQATLQKGFDLFQEFIDLGVLTYTGDKITPNRKMSENWEYNVNISSFTKFDEMIHLLTSNLGKYINANYWYDSTTREFVRFDTNIIYGSINDTNTTLQNVINLLSYPITTGFNITYNIGVLFTFIFVW